MYNLSLIMRKHQINPNRRSCSKTPGLISSKFQRQGKQTPLPAYMRLKRQGSQTPAHGLDPGLRRSHSITGTAGETWAQMRTRSRCDPLGRLQLARYTQDTCRLKYSWLKGCSTPNFISSGSEKLHVYNKNIYINTEKIIK